MVMPILDRLRQHQQDEAAGRFMGADVEQLPVLGGAPDPVRRGPLAALSALGLLMEGITNTATAGTGGGLALNAKLNPFMRMGLNDNAGLFSGTRLANEAATGFGQGRGNLVQRMMAANEEAARGDERTIGALNIMTDPTTYFGVGGGALASGGGRLAKVGKMMQLLDEAQGLGANRLGGAALKKLGIATDQGLRPEVTSFLRDRASGAGIGAATGAANASIYGSDMEEAMTGREADGNAILKGALAGGLAGGAIGKRNINRNLSDVFGGMLGGEGGYIARKTALRGATGINPSAESFRDELGEAVANQGVSLLGAAPSPEQILQQRQNPRLAADLVRMGNYMNQPGNFDLAYFRAHAGANDAALTYGRGAANQWQRVKDGTITDDEMFASAFTTIFSQQRAAVTPEALANRLNPEDRAKWLVRYNRDTTKAKAKKGQVHDPWTDLPSDYSDLPARIHGIAQVGPGGEEYLTKLNPTLDPPALPTGKVRPEDFVGFILTETEEGKAFYEAIKSGDKALIAATTPGFQLMLPTNVFGKNVKDASNWATEIPLARQFIVDKAQQGWTGGQISNELARLKLISGIGDNKSGFFMTHIGGGEGSATVDSNVRHVLDKLPKEAKHAPQAVQKYIDFLNEVYPASMFPDLGNDTAMKHHVFWDTLLGSNTGHEGIANFMGWAQARNPLANLPGVKPRARGATPALTALADDEAGDLFDPVGDWDMSMQSGINPDNIAGGLGKLVGRLRRTLPPEEAQANLGRFMEEAHPSMLDDGGAPKRFYHGTTAGNFLAWDTKGGSRGKYGTGAYFTEYPPLASSYASERGNPLFFPSKKPMNDMSPGQNVKPVYLGLKNPLNLSAIPPEEAAAFNALRGDPDAMTEWAVSRGYDGVILPTTGDPTSPLKEVVVFDPTAIKSATGNVGTYDPASRSMMHSGIEPGLVGDFWDKLKAFATPGPGKRDTPLTKPLKFGEQALRIKHTQEGLNARALEDIAANKELARPHFERVTGAENFDAFWDELYQRAEGLKTLTTGIGGKETAEKIKEGGRGLMSGNELFGMSPDNPYPRELLESKVKSLGIDKGARKNEAIAFGAGRGITDVKEAMVAYAEHFLRTQNEGDIGTGAGNLGESWDAVPTFFASRTEGQPALMQMGGGINFILDPETTPHTQTLHHTFMNESPYVLPMHNQSRKAFIENWTPDKGAELAEQLGREPRTKVGPEGDFDISGSPLYTGPKAATASRVASLIMSAPEKILLGAATDPRRAAVELLRGTPGRSRGPVGSATRDLAQDSSATRSEAMVHGLDLAQHAKGVLIKGVTEGSILESAQAARELIDSMGLDLPIYVSYAPGTDPNTPAGVFRLTPQGPVRDYLNPGRESLINEVRQLGLEDFGAGLGPGAVGRMVAGLGNETYAGAAMGGAAGFFSDEDDRTRGAMKGAALGAIGGTAFGKLAPELGRGVSNAYRRHAPDLVDDTVLDPAALAIAHQNGVQAQQEGGEIAGAPLKDLPRQIDDAWRAQVVNTFRGLALDASSLWLLVKDFGRDYGVDRATVKHVQGQLIANYHDPDPLVKIGDLGDTMEGWGIEGFLSDGNLDQTLGTSFSRAEIGENTMSTPQRFLTGAALSFTSLRDTMIPVVGPLVGGMRQVYAPYIDAAYRTLNGFQHAAPRIAFWDSALRRELPAAADKWFADASAKGFDFTRLQAKLTSGGAVRPSEVGQFLQNNYKGLTTAEVNAFQTNYQEALDVVAMKEADRIAHIFGDFRDKTTKAQPWKTFIGRVFPFSRYAMQFAPVGLEMAKRHKLIAGGALGALGASAYAVHENEEAPWNAGSIPISTETPGLGALARLRLGGQQGTMRIDPLSNFTGPISGETFSMGGGLPTDTAYDKAKGIAGRAGFSPHPILDSLASVTGLTSRNPSPASRTAPIEQAAELIPGMPTVPTIQGAFNSAKGTITGRTPDDFDPVARHYAELVLDQTGKPLEDKSNRQYLINVGDVDDPLWRQARQEVRLMGLVGGLASNLTPLTQSATGRGAEIVNEGYRDRITDEELLELAQTDPAAARRALADRDDDPRLRTYRNANTVDRNRELSQLSGPRLTPALTQMIKLQREEQYKRKDR